jgi:hypothetical protein
MTERPTQLQLHRRLGCAVVVGLTLFGGMCGPVFAQSATVEIVMRVFIPDPDHAGKAAGFIVRRPGSSPGSLVKVDVPTVGTECFLTDHRGFSSDSANTSRLQTRLSLTLAAGQVTVVPMAGRTTPGTTSAIECATGALRRQAPGRVDRDHLGHPAVADGVMQVIGQVTGTNVLAAHGRGPSIDYSFDLKWNASRRSLTASVTYGQFPAFEMYVRRPGGAWVTVITALPSSTPWSLTGDVWGVGVERRTVTVSVP